MQEWTLKDYTLQQWSDLLKRIQVDYPTALLAGGALRDLDNGRPIKDLDVFVQDTLGVSVFNVLVNTHGYHSGCPGQYIDAAAEVLSAHTLRPYLPGLDVNLIVLRREFDVRKVLGRLDFGLCELAFDGEHVIEGDRYQADKDNKRFTLTRADSVAGVKRSLKRYWRLQEKYPGWYLSVPLEFREVFRQANTELLSA